MTSLALSLTSSLLLVGTASGLVHTYDVASHQLLRSISTHKGLTISHISTMLRPLDLVGHVALSLSADGREALPLRVVAPFQRMRDPKAREAHEVAVALPPSLSVRPPLSAPPLAHADERRNGPRRFLSIRWTSFCATTPPSLARG